MSRKTSSDLKKRYTWCLSINERRRLEEIPPEELDRLLGCKVTKADGSLSDLLSTEYQSAPSQDLHRSYSISRDLQFASSV